MARKNLKVSETVHEELEVRKRRDESFDDVLKRELGIIPTTLDDLMVFFPDELGVAAKTVADYLRDDDRLDQYIIEDGKEYSVVYDSIESGRTIMQIRTVRDDPPYLDITYRNHRGEMETVCEIVHHGADLTVHGSYNDPKHGEKIEFGGEVIPIEEIEDELTLLRDTAYRRWGTSS